MYKLRKDFMEVITRDRDVSCILGTPAKSFSLKALPFGSFAFDCYLK
jgi:hypothetical protein